MKYLIDAQLPVLLCSILQNMGFDAIHVQEMSNKDETSDIEIALLAKKEQRIVVSKDRDFFHSHKIFSLPSKLLLISTGNIKNKQLFSLIRANFVKIDNLFLENNLIEITKNKLIRIG